MGDRLGAFACTSSIGPGATNMITGAALATVNRLPVLLLPGDVFASRIPDPVLQQLEVPARGDVSVNAAFQPLSRYWDRITRPEQIIPAAFAAMRVLASPAETGAVTLALPQDVQVEAYDYPDEFLAKRVWHIDRRPPEPAALARAVAALQAAKRPIIVAGGGVIYACASEALRRFVEETGIPVAETQAGKGSLPYDHPAALGAIGATGTSAANRLAHEAGLVIGAVNAFSSPTDVVVCAAGSMPGDLHKLWRARDRKQYHVEYGYSCMGYEIAGALGAKMAAPDREVYALVGDGSYLMLNEAIVTSLQERVKLVVVLVDNRGFASIGGLSRSLGTDGFGTQFRESRPGSRGLDSERDPAPYLPVDLAANAESLAAHVIRADGMSEFRDALAAAKRVDRTVVIHVEVDRYVSVPSYESWWEVPVAATSEAGAVRDARKSYDKAKQKQRRYL